MFETDVVSLCADGRLYRLGKAIGVIFLLTRIKGNFAESKCGIEEFLLTKVFFKT